MSRRNKIILLTLAGLLFIFLLIWFLMKPQMPIIRQGLNANTSPLPQAGNNIAPPAINTNLTPPLQEEPKVNIAVTLKSLASTFAERYGSFSNQADFKNLRDLAPLMTIKFTAENDEYIEQQRKKGEGDSVYYGITSKTVKSRLVSLNEQETAAEVRLTAQRREAKESINSNVKVFYQDIVVLLKKESGKWKVDSAEWSEK